MNIEISDSVIHSIVQKQIAEVSTLSQGYGKSNLESAVKLAILEMTKTKVIELIKGNPNYVIMLNRVIEDNIVETFTGIAKRIARDLGDSITSAIESEFRS